MDYMDTLTEVEQDQDLGSFAMLLLDSEIRHNAGGPLSSPMSDSRAGRIGGSLFIHSGPAHRMNGGVESGLMDMCRAPPMTAPRPVSCSVSSAPRQQELISPLSPPEHKPVGVTSPSGLKNFFRKRHKSIPLGPVIAPRPSDETRTAPSPGYKLRGVDVRRKSDESAEKSVRYGSSVPQGSVMSMPRSIPGSGGEGDMMALGGGDMYGTSMGGRSFRNMFQTCRRSISMRDSPIGPSEFLEMYRSRAYSETKGVGREAVQRLRQRRFSASPPFACGSLNGLNSGFEPRQVIIWRDQYSGTQVFRLPKTHEEEHCEMSSYDEKPSGPVYMSFLKFHTCYDVIPTSTKLVVFDTQLNVKKAFYALTYNGIRAAPLWDSERRDFTGMLTITDFIKVLMGLNCKDELACAEFELDSIEDWKKGESLKDRMIHIEPECSMFEAVEKLCEHRVHRLPVLDPLTGNILYVLTHKRLLRYVFHYFQYYEYPQPEFMDCSLGDLKLGTYNNIVTVQGTTGLLTAMKLLLEKRLSALPVVNSENQLIGLYGKADVIDVAAAQIYSQLDVRTVEQAMSNRSQEHEKLETCLRSESLGEIISRMVKSEVHRIVVVDKDNRVEGIVSLSDIMRFLVLSSPHLSLNNSEEGVEDRMTMSSCN